MRKRFWRQSGKKERSASGKRRSAGNVCLAVFLWALFLAMVFPFALLLGNSFMGQEELYETAGAVLSGASGEAALRIFPMYPTLRAYIRLLLDSPGFFSMFWNSCIQTGGVLLGQLLAAVPAAWAFAQFKFPGRNALWFLYMLLMILPFQVTMVSGYLVLSSVHLMDTHWAVILPGVFSTLPVFILEKFFAGIPETILEAARVDGAGGLRIFLAIGLPLGTPGIFSILILGFLEYWNAIEQPMTYLKTESLFPLSLYLPQITTADAASSFAASVVMLLPAVLLFLWGQDDLEQGIVASGIKE